MELKRAIQIISALIEGVDPYTGEVLDGQSKYSNQETTIALQLALIGLERLDKKEQRTKKPPKNAGKSWSLEEDLALVYEYNNIKSIKAISKIHERSELAIRSRLEKLGKITI